MKLFMGVAVAAMLIATPVLAQTAGETTATSPTPIPPSTCGALLPAPTLPDGATASRSDMDTANTTYTAWAEAYRQVIVCRHAEAQALRTQTDARVLEHNAAVEALNTATTTWEADVAEYNARPANRRR
ncbi:hypothetical protein [Terricaulis silvestris]|uniref:Uncharacterized protein n=1 Tax=Terricaulis silvestris TaxID=2686094 RepID=A0A6I6MK15_9CAUL|nr:hypothetical protein [Terricaulis silvestris]QGZ95615.1 hypothetical protein DSM104635_02465 [Terricaulis silvestris]